MYASELKDWRTGVRAGKRFASSRRRWAMATPLAALLSLILGCPPDTRIDVAALHEKEQRIGDVEPVSVSEDTMTLTDFQPYRITSGDVLKINITGLSEDYEETMIRARMHADGKVNLPLVGRVHVDGLDLEAVERAIIAAYVPDYVKSMSVFVEMDETEQTTVVVVGAAGARGLVTLPRNQRNVLYALERAGGFASGASSSVRVLPVGSNREPAFYNLENINDLRRALVAKPLESGDMVIVEAANASAIFVTGLLNAPGPIEIPSGSRLSVMRVIAAAGGLVDFLAPDEATLWRQMPDGEQVRVKLNIAKILNGEEQDLAVYAGDILDVPHTAKTRFLQWAVENIQIGPFGATAVYDPILEHRARLYGGTDGGGFIQSIFSEVGNPILDQIIGDAITGATPTTKTKAR